MGEFVAVAALLVCAVFVLYGTFFTIDEAERKLERSLTFLEAIICGITFPYSALCVLLVMRDPKAKEADPKARPQGSTAGCVT